MQGRRANKGNSAMAMTKCGECGRDISDKATACPGCGAPAAAPSTPKVKTRPAFKVLGWMLVALAITLPFIPKNDEGRANAANCNKTDALCNFKLNEFPIERACRSSIEHQATYGARWTDGITVYPFPAVIWEDNPPGKLLLLAGDAVEFKNESGAFLRMHYYCTYDLNSKVVVRSSASPGKMR